MISRGRICLYAPYLYPVLSRGRIPFAGGIEVQLTHLARGLVERSFDVSIATCDYGQPDGEVVDGIRLLKTFPPQAGPPVLRFFHPRLTTSLAALHRANAEAYMVQGAGMWAGAVYDFAHSLSAGYVFLAAHDDDTLATLPGLSSPRDRWWYRRALRGADVVIAQTEKQRLAFAREFARASEVIVNPVRLPASTVNVAQNGAVVWLATYRASKRPDWFTRLARELPDVRCIMCGVVPPPPLTTKEWDEANAAARECPNLEVLGPLPHERIGELFACASLFVHTSPAEGFPNTFLESWAHGVPTLTCFDPDRIIVREHLGEVYERFEPLVEGVRRWMADPPLRNAAGARARDYAEREHASGTVHDRMAAAFDRAIAAGRARRG